MATQIVGSYTVYDGTQWWPLEVTQYGNEYSLHYPFNREMNNLVKNHLGAYWKPEIKLWVAPRSARLPYGLDFLSNGPVRQAYYSKVVPEFVPNRPLREHQQELYNYTVFKRGVLGAHGMGLGKTLVGIEILERAYEELSDFEKKFQEWYLWVILPKYLITTWKNELEKWGSKIKPKFIVNSEVSIKKALDGATFVPKALIIDEIAEFRRASKRTYNAMQLTGRMFLTHGLMVPYVLGLSGEPAPRDYDDWYYPLEIVRPGFIREAKYQQFQRRLGVYESITGQDGRSFPKRMVWKTGTCAVCNKTRDDEIHKTLECPVYCQRSLCTVCNKQHFGFGCGYAMHSEPEVDEISLLHKRLAPAVVVRKTEDCVELPEVIDLDIEVEPTELLIEYAEAVVDVCTTTMEVLEKLQQLSDGFIYDTKGKATLMTETPKLDAFAKLVKEQLPSRLLCFSVHTASIDVLCGVLQRLDYEVIRIDGRGAVPLTDDAMNFDNVEKYFANEKGNKVALVGHPLTMSMGLNLQAAKMVVFYSNPTRPDHRSQAIARAKRSGADSRPITVVNLTCLGPDKKVLSTLRNRLEVSSISLEEIKRSLNERQARLKQSNG